MPRLTKEALVGVGLNGNPDGARSFFITRHRADASSLSQAVEAQLQSSPPDPGPFMVYKLNGENGVALAPFSFLPKLGELAPEQIAEIVGELDKHAFIRDAFNSLSFVKDESGTRLRVTDDIKAAIATRSFLPDDNQNIDGPSQFTNDLLAIKERNEGNKKQGQLEVMAYITNKIGLYHLNEYVKNQFEGRTLADILAKVHSIAQRQSAMEDDPDFAQLTQVLKDPIMQELAAHRFAYVTPKEPVTLTKKLLHQQFNHVLGLQFLADVSRLQVYKDTSVAAEIPGNVPVALSTQNMLAKLEAVSTGLSGFVDVDNQRRAREIGLMVRNRLASVTKFEEHLSISSENSPHGRFTRLKPAIKWFIPAAAAAGLVGAFLLSQPQSSEGFSPTSPEPPAWVQSLLKLRPGPTDQVVYVCPSPSEGLTDTLLRTYNIPIYIDQNPPTVPPRCDANSINEGLINVSRGGIWDDGKDKTVSFPQGIVVARSIVPGSNMLIVFRDPGPTILDARNYPTGTLDPIIGLRNRNVQIDGSLGSDATLIDGTKARIGGPHVVDFTGGLPAALQLTASDIWATGVHIDGRSLIDAKPNERFYAMNAGELAVDENGNTIHHVVLGDLNFRMGQPTGGLVRVRAGNEMWMDGINIDNTNVDPAGHQVEGGMGYGIRIEPQSLGDNTRPIEHLLIQNVTMINPRADSGAAFWLGSWGSVKVIDIVLDNIKVIGGRADYGAFMRVYQGVENLRVFNVDAWASGLHGDVNLNSLGRIVYAQGSGAPNSDKSPALNPKILVAQSTLDADGGVAYYLSNVAVFREAGNLLLPGSSALMATGPFPDIGDQNVVQQSILLYKNLRPPQGDTSLWFPGSSLGGVTDITDTMPTLINALVDGQNRLLYPRGQGLTGAEAVQQLGADEQYVIYALGGDQRYPNGAPEGRADQGAMQNNGPWPETPTPQPPTTTATNTRTPEPPTATATNTATATATVPSKPTFTRTPSVARAWLPFAVRRR